MLLAASVLALLSLASATQCPPPGSVRYMVPHETDCSKFYICAHGIPLLQSCPEGTHFNSNFMVCQNPVFAGCSNELPESELECSWPDFVLFRPHPDTCNKYYVCEYGTPLVFDCPGGTEFNAELKECVWPHESNCSIGKAPEPPQDGGSQNGRCEEGALSAHQDCSKYNICNHGVEVAQDCPQGLQWSSKVEQCVWFHESDCSNYGSDGGKDTPQDGGDDGPQDGGDDAPQDGGSQNGRCEEGALSAHQDCSKYNICNHGVEVAQDCPQGLQWSSKVEQCVWFHESDCSNNGSDGGEDAPQDGGDDAPQDGGDDAPQDGGDDAPQDGGSQNGRCEEGALSAHQDCSKYNICNHGVEVAQDCPQGLQWSSKVEQCVWFHESDCSNNGSDGGEDAPQDGGDDAPEDGGDAPQDGGAEQDGGSGCEEGALSAHEDCNKYRKCNHGVAIAMDCPPGLHWNSKLQYCDWPLFAGCV